MLGVVFLYCRRCKNHPRGLDGARGMRKGQLDIDFTALRNFGPSVIKA